MSKWKATYEQYRKLESNWQWHIFPLDELLFGAEPEKRVQEWESAGLQVPPQWAIRESLQIRQVIDEAINADIPLEDVYHAAIYMVGLYIYWYIDPVANHVYRGQRCCWPIIPKLFRSNPIQNEIDSELKRLGSLSQVLEQKYPRYNKYQRIAIAQHYSTEACVKTWLIDLTWDPWIALFFASLDGRPGDIGNVICFSRVEWEALSAGGKNRLGAIRLIKVPGVPRVEVQKAVFLDGSHPDLVEQYVAAKIEFRQQDKLIFEDSSRGVTKEKLFPENDKFLVSIAKWKTNPKKPIGRLTFKPPKDVIRPLQTSDYLEIALSWNEKWERPLTKERMTLIEKVCTFHAHLQKEQESINVTARSLHRLVDAVSFILHREIRVPSLSEAVQQYLSHADSNAQVVIEKILSEM